MTNFKQTYGLLFEHVSTFSSTIEHRGEAHKKSSVFKRKYDRYNYYGTKALSDMALQRNTVKAPEMIDGANKLIQKGSITTNIIQS